MGMYLGQPGRGPDLPWTGVGEGGGDDSIFQVFGISGLRLVQPLTEIALGKS
jgi:hypothetical protein